MVRPDQCGLQPGWKKARTQQQANAAWMPTVPAPAPQPATAPATAMAAQPLTFPPAPMTPTMPMSLPIAQPMMMQQQTANNMVGGVPQYCWPAVSSMSHGQMAYNQQQGRFM